jgi:hypothetical protein
MVQFLNIFKKYLKKFFVLPGLPSNEKNSSDHHNSYNKGPNLACNGLLESPLNFPSTKKVSKNPMTNWYRGCMPKVLNFIYGSHSPLGVKCIAALQFELLSRLNLYWVGGIHCL